MPLLIVIAIGVGAIYFFTGKNPDIMSQFLKTTPDAPTPNIMGLPDINAPDQGGSYDQSYDQSFMRAHDEFQVPWALLKAHAIRESALSSSAYRQEPTGRASYGLLQVLWWKGSNRFNVYGYSDDSIGDGSLLYDPDVNARIASQIILANWKTCHGNLRDTINMYNTGVKESVRHAPGNYVDDVLKYYSELVGKDVSSV